jgi:hypothetical protein
MKLVIFIYLLSNSLFAFESTCKALVRGKKNKLVVKTVQIKDLVSKTHFHGEYLKVLKRNSEEVIAFDSPDAFRACTVYYHSTIAKDYFKTNFDLKRFERARTLKLRIEMDLGFEESVHMMHENNGLFYNNAVTIPPSGNSRITDKPWHYEIWFAPKKPVKIDNSIYRSSQIVTSGPFMSQLLLGVGQSQATTIGIDLVRGSGFGASFYAKTLAMSVGITAVVPNILKWVSKPFKQNLFLDSGLIPEVIYHEYSHYALSEHLKIDTHAPVVEGVANFFAATIGKTDSILKSTKGYSKGLVEISAKDSKNYAYSMEDKKYAQLDFSFKFLYAFKETYGKEVGTQLIFAAIKEMGLTTGRDLKDDLIPALKKSIFKNQNSLSNHYLFNILLQRFGF